MTAHCRSCGAPLPPYRQVGEGDVFPHPERLVGLEPFMDAICDAAAQFERDGIEGYDGTPTEFTEVLYFEVLKATLGRLPTYDPVKRRLA